MLDCLRGRRKAQKDMSERKKMSSGKRAGDLAETVENAVRGLYYTSETDAEIKFFTGGKEKSLSADILLKQIGKRENTAVEERDFGDFFADLTKIEDWFGEEERETARKFTVLKKLLEDNLKDLRIFKVGKIEMEIYAVGLDESGRLAGIRTEAVET